MNSVTSGPRTFGSLLAPLALFPLLLAGPSTFAAPAPSASAEQTVTLDPFQVKAAPDNSYGALNSNSLTLFDTSLNNLPISADIFDEAFMKDVGATSVEGVIESYSAGAGTTTTALAGADQIDNQPGDRNYGTLFALRGQATPTLQRDSLLPIGTLANPGSSGISSTSNFDIESVQIIMGPQALLYDGGGAGGVINTVSKQARISAPAFGSYEFRVDEHGSKSGQLDFGASTGGLALRVAVVNSVADTRRTNIGTTLSGAYVQFAGTIGNTVARLSIEQTKSWTLAASYLTLTANPTDPTFGALNGDSLGYLLATNQAGQVDNGNLNWSNVNSFEGHFAADSVVDEFATLSVDSKWTPSLSTQLSVGSAHFVDDHVGDTQTLKFYAPTQTANPVPGSWGMGWTGYPLSDGVRNYADTAMRFSLLSSNDLFGGAAKSQSVLGVDYLHVTGSVIENGYYQADSEFNILNTVAPTAANRIPIAALGWSVGNGPVLYPIINPLAPRITLNGVNYVRAIENPINPALISAQNPQGTSVPGGATYVENIETFDGIYAINATQWLDGRLDTLLGARLEKQATYSMQPLAVIPGIPDWTVKSNSFNFNVGADYHIRPWLTPYVSVSDSYAVPIVLALNPYGGYNEPSHNIGEEAGLKVNSASGAFSGTLAVYALQANNQTFTMNSTYGNDINPSGLNGATNGKGTTFNANTQSDGVQLTLTAVPVSNWRLRLSAAFTNGTVKTNAAYDQNYNDQFYENSQGQITYADGAVVYVPATYNSKQLTVTSTTAGAVPLTAALISSPSSSYYANPNLTTGAIATGSAAANVLKVVSPTDGPILTGAVGLPISKLQLVASEIPGLAIPGTVSVLRQGQDTTGYPEFAMNFTNLYRFTSGVLKGFEVGGTVAAAWDIREYNYYPQGLATEGPTGASALFSAPTMVTFNPIFGYKRKFGRWLFSTQLNIYNVFNNYRVIIFPDAVTGWSTPSNLGANLNQQPRAYAWTNTISF